MKILALAEVFLCRFVLFCLAIVPASADETAAPSGSKNSRYWVAFAAEYTERDINVAASSVQINVYRDSTKSGAEKQALANCRAQSSNPESCSVRDSFNNGCRYYSSGTHPLGTAGWMSGDTPQEAYDACHAARLNCGSEVSGGCADPSMDLPRKIAVSSRWTTWAAIAAGTGSDDKYYRVSAGTSAATTRELAEETAVEKCNHANPKANFTCGVVTTFNHGCGFISIGRDNNGLKPLTWGTGSSAQQAYDNCRKNTEVCEAHPMKVCAD